MLLLDALVHFLWPPCCPRCGGDGPTDALCSACARCMPRLPPEERECRLATGSDSTLVTCLFRYEDPLRELLLRFKYRGDRHVLRGLIPLLLEQLPGQEGLGRPDAVIPIPMTWRRWRTRGFNQAALLGEPVAVRLGVPMLRRALWRRAHRPAQVTLTGAARRRNLKGVFAATGVRGRAILVVDDVLTTGATLEAAACALREAGARRVSGLCLCRSGGGPPERAGFKSDP